MRFKIEKNLFIFSFLIITLIAFPSSILAENIKSTNTINSYQEFRDHDDEDEPEVIKASITNITDSGYDITADFYSSVGLSKIYFLTWTKNNGKDDLIRPWPEVNVDGDKTFSYTYHVDIKDHNNETGLYCNEVYCRDIYGELSDDYELKTFIGVQNNNHSQPSSKDGYTVTIKAEPTNGGVLTGGGKYQKGKGVSVTAEPNQGFSFIGWYNNGQLISTESTYNFYVSNDTTLTAKFNGDGTTSADPVPKPETDSNDLTEIYRLYNYETGEHLYTISQDEVKTLMSNNWNYEGIGWKAPNSGTPVYRLFNSVLNEHLYTTDLTEIKNLTEGKDWSIDFGGEPIFYSGGNKPIYRLYNNETARHHLTTDEFEYSVLPLQGWKQEGATLFAAA